MGQSDVSIVNLEMHKNVLLTRHEKENKFTRICCNYMSYSCVQIIRGISN